MSLKSILLCTLVISICLVPDLAFSSYGQANYTSVRCSSSNHNEKIRPPGRLNHKRLFRNKLSYGRLTRIGRQGGDEPDDGPSDDEALAVLDRVLPKDCGQAPKSSFKPYISGGFDAEPGDYPSFVKVVKHYSQASSVCGGTIISNRHVLTAAHCVQNDEYETMEVIISMYEDDANAKRYKIGRNEFCPSTLYEPNADNSATHTDVALLTIVGDTIQFDDFVQPACLPKEPVTSKKSLRAVGLGSISDAHLFPKTLQVLPVRVEKCEPEDVHLSKVCFVSSDPKHVGDTCSGDSGGPIYGFESDKMTVVASTSYGQEECSAGTRGKSVNTDFYAIRTEIGRLMLECGRPDSDEPDEEQPEEPVEPPEEPEDPGEEPKEPEEPESSEEPEQPEDPENPEEPKEPEEGEPDENDGENPEEPDEPLRKKATRCNKRHSMLMRRVKQ